MSEISKSPKWLDDDGETWLVDMDADVLTDTDSARLAGCAPELLAACKALTAHNKYGRFGSPDFSAAINMARAAIAKAEGR